MLFITKTWSCKKLYRAFVTVKYCFFTYNKLIFSPFAAQSSFINYRYCCCFLLKSIQNHFMRGNLHVFFFKLFEWQHLKCYRCYCFINLFIKYIVFVAFKSKNILVTPFSDHNTLCLHLMFYRSRVLSLGLKDLICNTTLLNLWLLLFVAALEF